MSAKPPFGYQPPRSELARALVGEMHEIDFDQVSAIEAKQFFEQRLRYLQRGIFFQKLAQVVQAFPGVPEVWFDPTGVRPKSMIRSVQDRDAWASAIRKQSTPEHLFYKALQPMFDALEEGDMRNLILGEFDSGPNQALFCVPREEIIALWQHLATKPNFGRTQEDMAEFQRLAMDRQTRPARGKQGRGSRRL